MTEKELRFFAGKRILVTGHTGFKGSWLVRILLYAGAEVIGYSLEPEEESLFNLSAGKGPSDEFRDGLYSVIGDIRDYDRLLQVMQETRPEMVIHLAAQPIVRTGYEQPRYTYETNVIGTVNVLECIRRDTAFELPAIEEKDGLSLMEFEYLPAPEAAQKTETQEEQTGNMIPVPEEP